MERPDTAAEGKDGGARRPFSPVQPRPLQARPRYVQVAETLIQGIEAGHYPAGALLPTEMELAEAHRVSRHTVREAIRHVHDLGLISRRQGSGTRVKPRRPRPRYIAGLNSLADLLHYTHETRLEFLAGSEVVARGELARLLRCRAGQAWQRFEGLRFVPDRPEPISFVEMYLSPAYADIRRHIGPGQSSVFAAIEQHYGERIAEVEQHVDAMLVPADLAALLQVAPLSAALQTRRFYIGEKDRLISIATSIYPQDRFTFTTHWRREQR